jgi:hypothetical protein
MLKYTHEILKICKKKYRKYLCIEIRNKDYFKNIVDELRKEVYDQRSGRIEN